MFIYFHNFINSVSILRTQGAQSSWSLRFLYILRPPNGYRMLQNLTNASYSSCMKTFLEYKYSNRIHNENTYKRYIVYRTLNSTFLCIRCCSSPRLNIMCNTVCTACSGNFCQIKPYYDNKNILIESQCIKHHFVVW